MKRAIAIVLLAGAGLIPASLLAVAQNATPAYKPGLADLMTMTVQPRHIKLALAGHTKNWVYAKYELAELGDAADLDPFNDEDISCAVETCTVRSDELSRLERFAPLIANTVVMTSVPKVSDQLVIAVQQSDA